MSLIIAVRLLEVHERGGGVGDVRISRLGIEIKGKAQSWFSPQEIMLIYPIILCSCSQVCVFVRASPAEHHTCIMGC